MDRDLVGDFLDRQSTARTGTQPPNDVSTTEAEAVGAVVDTVLAELRGDLVGAYFGRTRSATIAN